MTARHRPTPVRVVGGVEGRLDVLVVEEGVAVRRLVRNQLERRGANVIVVRTVADGRDALRKRDFDAVIVESRLTDGSGLDLLVTLRGSGSSAYVLVLGDGATESDRMAAFDLGADDYIVLPFFARELAARVLAVRRRRDGNDAACLRVGPLEVDLGARRVVVAGKLVEMTAKEFDLLAFLVAHPGQVFSRDDLLRDVWHSAPDWQQAATVTEHVRRVRTKVEVDPQRPRLLRTVRGYGYRLDAQPAPDQLLVGTSYARGGRSG